MNCCAIVHHPPCSVCAQVRRAGARPLHSAAEAGVLTRHGPRPLRHPQAHNLDAGEHGLHRGDGERLEVGAQVVDLLSLEATRWPVVLRTAQSGQHGGVVASAWGRAAFASVRWGAGGRCRRVGMRARQEQRIVTRSYLGLCACLSQQRYLLQRLDPVFSPSLVRSAVKRSVRRGYILQSCAQTDRFCESYAR